jgi:hypothetical protein
LSPAWVLQGVYCLLFLRIQESTWKQNSYIGFPVQLLRATNRVGEIRNFIQWFHQFSCHVKSKRNLWYWTDTVPTQNIHNCSISLKKMVSCLVLATTPHKGNAAASIFISRYC